MKPSVTLLLACLIGFSLHAQPVANSQLKTTALNERLIASSQHILYSNQEELLDSFAYKYSGTNGSRWRMESGHYFDYDNVYNPGMPHDYPYDWDRLDIAADSMWEWRPDANQNAVLYYQRAAAHNNNGMLDSAKYYYYDGMTPYPGVYVYHSYDAQGMITRILMMKNSANGTDTVGRIDYYYNQQGEQVFDSIRAYSNGAWPAWAAVSRTFDAQGNLASLKYDQNIVYPSPHWVTREEYHYTYYSAPDNRLKTMIFHYPGAPRTMDSMTYAGSNPIPVSVLTLEENGSQWIPKTEVVRHMNAQGLPDSIFFRSAGGPLKLKDTYTYSSYGNPTERLSFSILSTTLPPFQRSRYYYEVYNDPTSVATVKLTEEIKLYPNPATDQVTLRWKEGSGKRVSMQLVNAAGQQVMNAMIHWQGTDQHFSIRHLATGMYWLVVRDEKGAVMFREGVVKD